MGIFARFDADGMPLGFYHEELHGDAIPEDAIAITREQWSDFIEHQGQRRWDGEAVIAFQPQPLPAPTPAEKLAAAGLTVDELKELLGLS